MAFTNNYMNELFGTVLVLSALLSTTSAVDCYGKSFHCVNSTHFMICVDLGGGVSQAIEDFYIACPPPTVCQGNNHFECEFPAPTTPDTTLNHAISETTLPWEEIVTVSSLNNTTKEFSENYMDTTVEKGTTTAVEYSVTTDTTVDVTSKTATDVYIINELNVTEVAATIAAETTTDPIEIIPQTLNEVTVDTQITDNIITTGIEILAQPTVETNNLTKTEIVVAGEENITTIINNTQTTTINKVITETVTGQIAPITTEQIIQTTTNDPLEQQPSYLYTDLPQVINLLQNESIRNKTSLIESSVVNKNIQDTEKQETLTLNNSTKNKDLFSISENANVTQPDNISQNVEITSTVESIVENTIASIEHLISLPNDNNSTDVYQGSTVQYFVNKLKPYHSGLHKDTPASTKLEGSIESKLPSDKEKNKESQINQINHAVGEITPTIGKWVSALNKENLSTTPYNDVLPELAVTTDLPFVNDAKENVINTTDTNVIDNTPVIIFTYAQTNDVTTTLDGIFATETFGNNSSSDQPTTINEENLIKESTQNAVTVNFDIVTTETVYANNSNSNVQSVTVQAPLIKTVQQNSELGGAFITENFQNTASTEQPTTINQQSLTIGTTQNVVIEDNFIPTSEVINQGTVSIEGINKHTNVINAQPMTTEAPSLVTNTQHSEDTKLDPAFKVNEKTMATDTPAIITAPTIMTEGPNTKSQTRNTLNLVYTELDGRFITENVENTASTEQITTVYEQSVTVDANQVVVINDIIPTTTAVYQGIVSTEAMYEPTTIISLHPTTTEPSSLVTKTQNFEDKVSIVEFGSSTEQIKAINEETTATNTPDIIIAKPMMTVDPSLGIKTPNSAGTKDGGAFINNTTENIAIIKHPNTINEQSLTMDTTQNVVAEDIIIPTSEAAIRGIMSTEAVHEPSTIIKIQPMITEAPSLVTKTKNSENTKQDAAFIIKGIEFDLNTDLIGTTDTSANVAIEKITIRTNQAVHTVIRNTQPPTSELNTTTEAPLLTTMVQTPITKQDGTINTPIEDIDAIAEKAITINRENSTKNFEPNFALDNIITPTRQAVKLDITTNETPYTHKTISNDHLIPVAAEHMSNKNKLVTTQRPISEMITDRALNSETVDNSAGTTQPTAINEESVTTDTDTAHNVASTIIPKIRTVKENKTAAENQNVTIIPSNAQTTSPKDKKNTKVPLLSLEVTASIKETGSTNVVTAKPAVLSLEQKKLQLSENNLASGAGLETVVELTSDTNDLLSTNAIELNVNMEPTMSSIPEDTVTIDKGSNTMVLTTASVQSVNINDNSILNIALSKEKHVKASAINEDNNANQDNFKIETKIIDSKMSSGINVPENLPSLQYTIHGISKQNSNNIILSESLGPEKESNDISNQAFNESQQGKTETILVTNDGPYSTVQPSITERKKQADNINLNPLANYIIDKSSQNPESARKSSVTKLTVEQNNVDPVRHDMAFVSQQPFKSTSPASSSISDGPNDREQSTTETKTSIEISTNGLLENITKINSELEIDTLSAPEPKTIAKEDSVNLKTSTIASGGLAVMSTTVPTRATVAETTMLDSIQNAYVTVTAFFNPGSKSTVDETGNNLGKLGSNANVFPDKTESEIPKTSKDPISPSQSVIYKYKLTTNGQDVSETTSTGISTKGDIINEKVNAYRKPVMLDVLPLPINNVGLHSPVTNMPVVRDFMVQAQNGNIAQITESYKTVTFNPALANTGKHASINGVDFSTARTLRNPSLNMQAGVTDEANVSPKNPTFGDSASVGNLQIKVLDKNNHVSTLGDATFNSTTEIVDRADISTQHLQQVEQGPIEKTSATDYPNIQTHIEQRENKIIKNVLSPISTDNMNMGVTPGSAPEIKNQIHKSINNLPEDSIVNTVDQKTNSTIITDLKYNSQNGSETNREAQQNNSPINHALSTQTQKTYTSSTIRALSQSVTQKPISRTKNITKPVSNDTIAFNCIKGKRGRYSDKDDCRKFYICVGKKQPIVGNCPENTVFSDVKKLCTKNLSHCIRQNEFKCPSAGRFSDFLNDNVYYICVSHKNHLYKFKFQCQKGYILNKTTVKCIETKEIESNESVSISLTDSSIQTGSPSTVSSSNNSNSISTSTISNTSNGGDSSSKSEDSSKTKKSNEAEEMPEEPEGNEKKVNKDDEDDEVFKCKKEGKFPIRNECRRYYLCKKKGSHYRRKVKKCESGSVFHKDKKKCVDDDDYEC